MNHRQNTYHILVVETSEHLRTEWFGDLTLFPQENGETYLDISFSELPFSSEYQEQPSGTNLPYFSIENLGINDC